LSNLFTRVVRSMCVCTYEYTYCHFISSQYWTWLIVVQQMMLLQCRSLVCRLRHQIIDEDCSNFRLLAIFIFPILSHFFFFFFFTFLPTYVIWTRGSTIVEL